MSAGDKTKGASSIKPSATKKYAIKVAIKLILYFNYNYHVYDIISYFYFLFLNPTFIMLLNFLSALLTRISRV